MSEKRGSNPHVPITLSTLYKSEGIFSDLLGESTRTNFLFF